MSLLELTEDYRFLSCWTILYHQILYKGWSYTAELDLSVGWVWLTVLLHIQKKSHMDFCQLRS